MYSTISYALVDTRHFSQSYQRANMLTAADVEAIRRYDKQSALRMRELVVSVRRVDGVEHCTLSAPLSRLLSRPALISRGYRFMTKTTGRRKLYRIAPRATAKDFPC